MRSSWTYLGAPIGLAAALALAASGCGDSESGADGDAGPVDADDSGGDDDVCDEHYDCGVFEEEIMPAFEDANCLGACHGFEAEQGGFGLHEGAEPGSDEMAENFNEIDARVDLAAPENSVIYFRSDDNHNGITLPEEDQDALLDWLEDASDNWDPGNGNGSATGCLDDGNFNVGVFEDDIFPVLDGLDLNTGDDRSLACTGETCHAIGGQSSRLTLDPSLEPEENLENLACFINFANPVQSQILLCPRDQPGCAVDNHPGGDFFPNNNDLNYQRILGYIYGSTDSSPLDLAFFAANIQPIFDDEDDFAVGDQTCQDPACHGISSVGDTPANRSNFPILRGVGEQDLAGLTENFVNATAFTNFEDAEASSLFLFPTDQLPHQGRDAIDLDDDDNLAFAEDVLLNWIDGLRPDENGIGRHWLVAGSFQASGNDEADDIFPFPGINNDADEQNDLRPNFLDETPNTIDSNSSRDHKWVEFFNDDFGEDEIDLDIALPDPGDGDDTRVAYAVAYALIDDSTPTTVRLNVTPTVDGRVYFGSASQLLQADNATLIEQTIAPYDEDNAELVPIIIKLFADEDDDFAFTAEFRDGDNDLLTDEDELIFLLGAEGGI